MKEFGSIRKIDNLGRITIPIEFRNIFNIKDNDLIEISCSKNEIILKKHDTTTNYDELIKKLITGNNKDKCKTHLVTDKNVLELKKVINEYINNLYDE